MTKISIDVEEIKKNLKATALTARSQLTELARRAQKDLSQKEVLKKLDQVVEAVKAQDFMKNPRVVEITKKIMDLSEHLESVTKNASDLVGQVRARVSKVTETKATTHRTDGRVEAKTETRSASSSETRSRSAGSKKKN